MRTVTTNRKVVEALSRRAAKGVLLLQGPGSKQVIVMSPKEYLRRSYLQESPLPDRHPSDTLKSQESKIVHIEDYVCKQES
jgi:hypothetical protein